MTNSTREHIVGYVLGCLEQDELTHFEAALEQDTQLQLEVDVVRAKLSPLEATVITYDPPPALAKRTCDFIFSGRPGKRLEHRCIGSGQAVGTGRHVERVNEIGSQTSTWTVRDLVGLVSVVAIIGVILFPSIFQSRAAAMKTACQDNLRHLGYSFAQYVEQNHGFYPRIDDHGNLAVAGVFPVRLIDSGTLKNATYLVCPSSELADGAEEWTVPTLDELRTAEANIARQFHATMGGSYAYNMGFVRNDRLTVVRYQARPNYPIISDAPMAFERTTSLNHGGHGQNVLFEDGHIEYVTCSTLAEHHNDDIFLNRAGKVAAGLDPMDAVLGCSSDIPVTSVRLER